MVFSAKSKLSISCDRTIINLLVLNLSLEEERWLWNCSDCSIRVYRFRRFESWLVSENRTCSTYDILVFKLINVAIISPYSCSIWVSEKGNWQTFHWPTFHKIACRLSISFYNREWSHEGIWRLCWSSVGFASTDGQYHVVNAMYNVVMCAHN